MIRRLVPALLALALATSPACADFADGARAYDGGDYATAFREWQTLAKAGDTDAQIALAEMYRSGTGRPVDLRAAASWYRKAAQAGDAIAQANLAEMYAHGWGVARDGIAAYLWFSRAAAKGNVWAAGQRDSLRKRMSAADRAEARRRLGDRPR